MPDAIDGILRRLGPCSSSSVAKALVDGGMLPAAARKAVSRTKARRLDLRLPKGELFLCTDQHVRTRECFEAIRRTLQITGAAAGWALEALDGRGGRLPISLFHSKSGSPRGEQKGHVTSDEVLEVLRTNSVVATRHFPSLGECLQFTDDTEFAVVPEKRTRAVLLAEDVLIGALNDWTARLGLVSFNSGKVRSESDMPRVGSFEWDFSGPSYLLPIATGWGQRKTGGFVAADVSFGRRLTESSITFALRKSSAYRRPKNALPLLQILVADGFEKKALRIGREEGVMMATPGNLFGEDVATALRDLVETLSSTAEAATKDPERLYRLLSTLSRSESAIGQIRGPLFELATFLAVSLTEAGSAKFGERAKDRHDEEADIDVLVVQEKIRTLAIECKGKLGSLEVDVATAEDWLTRQVPRMDDYLLQRYQPAVRKYEIWTTGRLSAEAVAYLSERRSQLKKYEINWRTGDQVRQYFAATKNKPLCKLLDDFYIRHPATASQRVDRTSGDPSGPL